MGTGPFKFVEYVRGSHWVGKKNPDYWDKGKPYLDGFRAIFIPSSSAQVAAIRGERAMIQFRGFTPGRARQLVSALGNKITVQESPWNCSIGVDAPTSRRSRSTTSACAGRSRWPSTAGRAPRRSRKIALVKEVAGIQVPGTPWATPPGRAGEAGRLRPRHQRRPRRGQAAAEGGGRREPVVHAA